MQRSSVSRENIAVGCYCYYFFPFFENSTTYTLTEYNPQSYCHSVCSWTLNGSQDIDYFAFHISFPVQNCEKWKLSQPHISGDLVIPTRSNLHQRFLFYGKNRKISNLYSLSTETTDILTVSLYLCESLDWMTVLIAFCNASKTFFCSHSFKSMSNTYWSREAIIRPKKAKDSSLWLVVRMLFYFSSCEKNYSTIKNKVWKNETLLTTNKLPIFFSFFALKKLLLFRTFLKTDKNFVLSDRTHFLYEHIVRNIEWIFGLRKANYKVVYKVKNRERTLRYLHH